VPQLTLFTCPKPFRGQFEIIQRNALSSWVRLRPAPDILLVGREEGVAEAASQFGVRHAVDLEYESSVAPRADSLFRIAHREARTSHLCFVHTDIILRSDFMECAERLISESVGRPFLGIGSRWNLNVREPLDFKKTGWETSLRTQVADLGRRNGAEGVDYFIFSRSMFRELPCLTLGSVGFDGTLVYEARRSSIPVVDCSRTILAVHQNHPSNVQSGAWTLDQFETEKRRVLLAAGGHFRRCNLLDSTHVMAEAGVVTAAFWRKIGAGLIRFREFWVHRLTREWHPYAQPLVWALRTLRKSGTLLLIAPGRRTWRRIR
jgi:hypothetical protein